MKGKIKAVYAGHDEHAALEKWNIHRSTIILIRPEVVASASASNILYHMEDSYEPRKHVRVSGQFLQPRVRAPASSVIGIKCIL